MVFDIWRDVLVMRIGARQVSGVRVLEGVVPSDLLAGSIDFVAVVANPSLFKVKKLPYVQDRTIPEDDLPFEFRQ